MRHLLIGFAIPLAGCQQLQLEYRTPAKSGDVQEVAAQAADGYQYAAMPKMVIVVAPASAVGAGSKESAKISGASGSSTTSDTAMPAARIGKPTTTPQAAQGAASSAHTSGEKSAQAPAAAASAAASKAEASSSPTGDNLTDRLAQVPIGETTWAAAVVPTADPDNAFSVRGVSGFWQRSSLSIAYYPNTDVPTSLSSKAENLFPKRIEQLTGIVSSLIKLGVLAVSEQAPLLPFKLEVPKESMGKAERLQDGWTYRFEFIEDKLQGTISLAQFKELVKDKKVGYWPVPACRRAQITLVGNAATYRFPLIVSSADHVRLQPLPVDGKTDLGTVCNASVSGQAAGDALADAQSNLAALQQAVAKLESPAAAASAPKN